METQTNISYPSLNNKNWSVTHDIIQPVRYSGSQFLPSLSKAKSEHRPGIHFFFSFTLEIIRFGLIFIYIESVISYIQVRNTGVFSEACLHIFLLGIGGGHKAGIQDVTVNFSHQPPEN